MRKKFCSVMLFLIAFMLFTPYSAFALNQAVIDDANYLTDEEVASLCGDINEIRDKYGMDVAVVIEDTMSGYDAESTADDIFDYNGYGYGVGKGGIMLYISKNPRKYHYTTHGSGISVFNARALEYIDEQVLPYLREDDYYNAIYTYAETARSILAYDRSEGDEATAPYNQKDGTTSLIVIAAVILGPVIIALIATGSKLKQMKTAVPQNYADSYMKRDSMNLSNSRDIFMYSVVNRTEKPKSDSGTHTSSSGEMHGGRGGGY